MANWKVERQAAPVWVRPLLPLISILITFIMTGLILVAMRVNPFEA